MSGSDERGRSTELAVRLGGTVVGHVDERRGYWRCECGDDGYSADVSAMLRMHQHRRSVHSGSRERGGSDA